MKKYKCCKSFRFAGKLYHVYADTEAEAMKKMILKQHDLETGHVTVDGNMYFKEWAAKCFEAYKTGVKDNVKRDQWYQVTKHIFPYIGEYQLKSIKPVQCQEVLNQMAGMSFSSVTKVRDLMNFILEKAVQNEMIFKNPASHLNIPQTTKGRRRTITSYERKHFLTVVSENPRFIFFLFMLKCGCRPEEVAELRGSDIRMKDGVYLLHIRGTKTENSDRMVPLPADLYEMVKDKGPFELLCTNCAGSKYDKSSYNRLVASLKRALNISMGVEVYRNRLVPPLRLAPDFVPYDFRHTYCTDLQKAGVDVRTAQRLMGHANISITANIYTHVDEGQIIEAAHLLGAKEENSNSSNSVTA